MEHANTKYKIIGRYIISIIIFIFAIAFSFTINNFTLGDEILNFFKIPSWSNGDTGTHYTIIYTVVFSIISYLIIPKNNKKNA